jgi:hypothetical protein
MERYSIPDEPRPGVLQKLVVEPMWPLLAAMMAGCWLAWPWLCFNAYAMGSPTARREVALCALGLVGNVVLGSALLWAGSVGLVRDPLVFELLLLAVTGWRLGISYVVVELQSRTFHIYAHYDGPVRSGRVALLLGILARSFVLGLVDGMLWPIVVGGGI